MFGESEQLRIVDLKLIQRAIRNRWPVPLETRTRIANLVAKQDFASAKSRLQKALQKTFEMMANVV